MSKIDVAEEERMWRFVYDTELCELPLECYLEYEPAQRGAREWGTGVALEPDYPETFTLQSVFIQGEHPRPVEVTGLLSNRVVEEIERAFMDQWERERDVHDAGRGQPW